MGAPKLEKAITMIESRFVAAAKWPLTRVDASNCGIGQPVSMPNRRTARSEDAWTHVSIASADAYSFDGVRQLVGRLYPDGSRNTFLYDSVGNRVTMQDTTGTYTSTYDALDKRQSMVTPAGEATTYGYDSVGMRDFVVAPTGGRFTYAYTAEGQESLFVNAEGQRTSFSYDAAGRRTLTELATGSRSSVTYDAASQVTQDFNLKSDDSVASSFGYGYDAVGNRTSVLEADGARVTWTYDAANQLIGEARSGANAYDHSSQFDPLGNRLVKNEDGALTTSTYDAANQLKTSLDSSGVTSYTFDAAGNQQVVEEPSGARTTNTWSYENQTTLVVKPSGARITSMYNADNRRVRKEQ